jgi:hypothetical protein
MSALVTLLTAILRVLIPALVQESKDTAQDVAPATELKRILHARVKQSWGAAAVVLCLFFLSGCFTRTIYVPDGTPVRLRETIDDAKVWVLDNDGKPVPGKLTLPEGWYVLPNPRKERGD